MRAWVIDKSWDFEGLNIEERPIPEPGPDEVVLKMRAASLNFRDQLVVHRGYGRLTGELPLVPLSDGVGDIKAIGENVRHRKVGERVCVCFNQMHVDGEFTDDMLVGLMGGPLPRCRRSARNGTPQRRRTAEQAHAISNWYQCRGPHHRRRRHSRRRGQHRGAA